MWDAEPASLTAMWPPLSLAARVWGRFSRVGAGDPHLREKPPKNSDLLLFLAPLLCAADLLGGARSTPVKCTDLGRTRGFWPISGHVRVTSTCLFSAVFLSDVGFSTLHSATPLNQGLRLF